MDILTTTFYENTVQSWLIGLAVTLVTFVILRFAVVRFIGRVARMALRSERHWDDVIAEALKSTKSFLFLVVALVAGSSLLSLPSSLAGALRSLTVIALLLQVGLWVDAGLTAWLENRRELGAAEDPTRVMTLSIVTVAAKLVLWSMVLLMALDNLGFDVTALVAGLGVGGVAVALAAQNILGDLFASLSIVLDKPFVLGDFLIVGDFLGSVEAIGLKTTRVRSLSGEQVVFSNADLLASRIRNYGRMYERRVAFELGVTYQTPRDRLEAIPGMIRDAIQAQGEDRVRFDRAHMSKYGDFAIVFEAVYYVLSPDFNVHMDIKQDIFLRLHEAFEERDISFAYPTQTLFLKAETADAPEPLARLA